MPTLPQVVRARQTLSVIQEENSRKENQFRKILTGEPEVQEKRKEMVSERWTQTCAARGASGVLAGHYAMRFH